jgi:RNA 2',3'-cyclic 3'-phosphodiesterase
MRRGATARLFVAVDPPASVCEELAAWARRVTATLGRDEHGPGPPSLRLLAPDLLHLTLCFLGSRPVGEIAALADALEPCAEAVGELTVGAPLWLPHRRPRTLAVEIRDPDGELAGVQTCLSRTLAAAGSWEPERRRFRAHVTVARVRGRRALAPGDVTLPPTPRASFEPRTLILYRSWLTSDGASYEEVASCALMPG